ncbi:MAG: toxin-antitoxin system YwqK family antitoxin, partial [Chitinophagaceae bacterium]
MISVNNDTINKVDMQGLKQGKWVIHLETLRGEPGFEEEGIFVDGKKEGIWRRFSLMGDLIGIEQYKWGFRDGKQSYYTPMGALLREEGWRSVNPENPYDTLEVPDLDNPLVTKTKVVKLEVSELRHGNWIQYDPITGRIVKQERYVNGDKIVSSAPGGSAVRNTSGGMIAGKGT